MPLLASSLALSAAFLPHGYCLLWDPVLLWTLVGSHVVIGLSYYSIPVALIAFLSRQKNLRYNWVFWLFSLFIFACGTTHFVGLVNIWYPIYRIDAAVMAVTAGISLATAIMLWPLVPQASRFIDDSAQTRRDLEHANRQLSESLELLVQQRAETAASERRFRLTFENAPLGLALVDLSGTFIDVNQALCYMLGYSEAELVGRSFGAITHPDDLAADLAHVGDLTSGQADSYHMEKRYLHRLGHDVHVLLDVVMMRDEQGKPLLFISQITDISQRKRVEKQLQENTQRMEEGLATLQRQNREITALGELSRVLQACNSIDEMVLPIREYLGLLFPGHSGATYLMHASRNYFERIVAFGQPEHDTAHFDTNACWALRREAPHWLGHAGLRCEHIVNAGSDRHTLCTPLTAQGGVIGVLYLESGFRGPEASEYLAAMPHVQQLAVMVADRVAIAVANVNLRETLRAQSVRDPLTGLLNRRYLEEALPRELDLARRESHPLAVLMIDVDHFKQFNDAHGHDAGDKVLRQIGQQFQRQLRSSDIVCRLGGEEFAVILPRATQAEARAKAEQLCEVTRNLVVSHHGMRLATVTISIGMACFPEHGTTMQVLLETADQCLYSAKKEGRDRVICALRPVVSAEL